MLLLSVYKVYIIEINYLKHAVLLKSLRSTNIIKLKQKKVYDKDNILLVMLMLIHLAFFIRLFATGMGHWLINISVWFERLYRMHTRPQFSGSRDT